ncbi:MAG TPA: hypothetical protein VE715_12775 [Blastocatellia bacterium]|nr:hypothetical protein [Blastocatellia bacterium]
MKSSKSLDTNLGARMRRRIFLCAATLALFSAATVALGRHQDGAAPPASSGHGGAKTKGPTITPIPFGEMNGDDVYNASGVVPLADSRFLFCDNNCNDSLFELDLTEDGQKKGPLIRRPLQGLAPNAIDDMEAMTLAEEKGRRFIFVASSLCVKKTKDGQSLRIPPSGLLRVTVNSDDGLSAENMPGFRDWFIKHAPIVAASANRIPDEGGLNIEGLAWDHERHALLFGVRTPLSANNPLVIPVKLKDLDGPWTTSNLKMLPPIQLSIEATEAARGIRSIEYVASLHAFLVVIGKAISGQKAPFALYEWKGGKHGKTRRLNVSFAPKMKPEGLTSGTVAGRPALLYTDDGGGYQVFWLDQLRF